MKVEYLATEFAGDPPQPAAKWFKVHAGTYARSSADGVEFVNAAALKRELSVGTTVTFVTADDVREEAEAVDRAWTGRQST